MLTVHLMRTPLKTTGVRLSWQQNNSLKLTNWIAHLGPHPAHSDRFLLRMLIDYLIDEGLRQAAPPEETQFFRKHFRYTAVNIALRFASEWVKSNFVPKTMPFNDSF